MWTKLREQGENEKSETKEAWAERRARPGF
jgi:hypothetical protein